jgi:hypothetical protein
MEGRGMNIKALAKQADIDIYDFMDITKDELANFAELVAAHEREECAKVCDARFMGDLNREDQEAKNCARAIRARGKT